MKSIIIVIVGIVAFIYLLNPTAGFFEFIPDNIPVIGNIDEAGATALLIASLGYFGIDFANFFKKEQKEIIKKETTDTKQ